MAYKAKMPDPNLLDLLEVDPEAFDATVEQVMGLSPFMDWGMRDSMWHHGVDTPSALMREGQAKPLYHSLECSKSYVLFTQDEAAQFHVQPGASAIHAEKFFNWLDGVPR